MVKMVKMLNKKVSELMFFIFFERIANVSSPVICPGKNVFKCSQRMRNHMEIMWAKNIFSGPFAGFEARRAQNAKKRKIFLNVNHSKGFIPSPGLCHYKLLNYCILVYTVHTSFDGAVD